MDIKNFCDFNDLIEKKLNRIFNKNILKILKISIEIIKLYL